MFRRAVTLMITLMLVVSMTLSASAEANGLTLEVGSVTTARNPGEEIRVPVAATVNTGYISTTATLRWDNTALVLIGIEFTDLAPDQGTPPADNNGFFTLRIGRSARRENFTGTGLFFTAVFRISNSAAPGDYEVAMTNIVALDTDLRYLAVSTIPGTARLLENAAVQEPDETSASVAAPTGEQVTEPSERPAADDDVSGTVSDSVALMPTDVPVVTVPETAVPTDAKQDASSIVSPDDGDDGGSTIPWLTITVAAVVLCATVAVIFRRRKNG